MGQRFCRHHRLTDASDFSRVFDQATVRETSQNTLLLGRLSENPVNRLGMIVAKKNVPRAVDRNRIKRLMREVFRNQSCLPSQSGLDVVLLVRKKIPKHQLGSLYRLFEKQLRNLFLKAREKESRDN